MTKNTKPQKTYVELIKNIGGLLEHGRKRAVIEVNSILVDTYWNIGGLIIEHEQNGKEKTKYGSGLLKKLSKELTNQFGKGFSVQNLERMRNFYLIYPNIRNSSTVSRNLSWSHYVRLMSIKNKDERSFYEIECIENNWSLRELNRQFDSSLYERLALSTDKIGVKKLAQKGQIIEKPKDTLKEPYILEFLGIDEHHKYSENDLETAIIDNLEKFLLELGKGFTFVSRQQRITNGPDHYFIDLVFYNRLLNCFVLIDLKIGKLKHQDVGQMQMYTNYYDREIKAKTENKTIGMILCKEKDDFIIKYTLPDNNKQIFAKEYKLYLPKKEDLEAEIKKIIE